MQRVSRLFFGFLIAGTALLPRAAAAQGTEQAAPAASGDASRLSLGDAIDMGLRHSFAARIAASRDEAAAAGVGEAWVSFLPDLSASAGLNAYERTVNPRYVFGSGITGSDLRGDSSEANLTASYVLFSTTRRLDLRAAQLRRESQAADTEAARRAVVRDVVRAFLAVVQDDALLRLADQHVVRRTRLLEETRAMVRAGKRAEFELLRVEAELASADASQVEARNNARIARSTLAQVIGKELPLDFTAVPPAPPADPRGETPPAVREVVDASIVRRPEVDAAEADARAARIGWRRVNRRFVPTLALFARYNRLIEVSRFDPFDQSVSYGGQLEIRFSDVLANTYRSRASRAEARIASIAADQTRVQVSLEIERATLEADRAAELLAAVRKSLAAAMRSFESTAERYRLGLATQTERIDAEANLVEAEVNEVRADVGYRNALWNLRYEMGVPLET